MTDTRRPQSTATAAAKENRVVERPQANRVTPHVGVVKWVAAGVAPLIAALAVLGGAGSFTTIRRAAEPHFGELAWIVPVGMDVGILILLAWDLLMEYLDMPWPVLRWVAWLYIAGTVLVNVTAAHGDLAGSVMNAAMPVLFITVVEGVRHLIRRWVGLTSASRVEGVPTARWALAPVSSLLLWRRMILWHITEYRQGLDMEHRHLMAVSELQQEYGRWAWRWRAPLADRLALDRLPAQLATQHVAHEEAADGNWQSIDDHLMVIARNLQLEVEREGVQLSRDRLGRRLRELGFTIANHRLSQIIAAVRAESARQESS